jgi:hypothetical protein
MGDMYREICSWENLRFAHRRASRGKRGREAAAARVWVRSKSCPPGRCGPCWFFAIKGFIPIAAPDIRAQQEMIKTVDLSRFPSIAKIVSSLPNGWSENDAPLAERGVRVSWLVGWVRSLLEDINRPRIEAIEQAQRATDHNRAGLWGLCTISLTCRCQKSPGSRCSTCAR